MNQLHRMLRQRRLLVTNQLIQQTRRLKDQILRDRILKTKAFKQL